MEDEQIDPVEIPPLDESQYELGKYAAFPVSDQPMYGPDQLGPELTEAINQLCSSFSKMESAARIYEVLQRWEARLFKRNYQHVTCNTQGWGMMASGSPQQIMAGVNNMKLFPFNIYGSRARKITAALSRQLPELKFCPEEPGFAPDEVASDERDKYLEVWMADTNAKSLMADIADLQYTDDRVALLTESYADQQRWGTEAIGDDGEVSDGDVPETEGQPQKPKPTERPAVCEITTAWGVLEHKVSIVADDENEIGAIRFAKERNVNLMKEKYPWIETKIKAGGGLATGSDQMDRMARMNVRLGVQNSTVNGESYMQDSTEYQTFFRPSEYRAAPEKLRQILYDTFPDGLRVNQVGNELAFARNQSMNDHVKIVHAYHGSGQNRLPIGGNYLPIQKVLNGLMTLANKYYVGAVPRRLALEGPLNTSAINRQRNDPALITGVDPKAIPPGQTLRDVTALENATAPNDSMMLFIQWLANEAATMMDGATDAMFGQEDTDTFGEAKLNRDQALQVFGTPWSQICWALAGAAQQAANCARANRKADFRSRTPGKNTTSITLENMKGNALCYPKSLDIPETVAEEEARVSQIFELAATVPMYAAIANDPNNWALFEKFLRNDGITIKQVESVKKQQGEFEVLLATPPADNPQLLQATLAMQQLQLQLQNPDPAVQMQVEQQIQQMEQVLQAIPPKVSSVPVAQDDTEDHATEAGTCWIELNSEKGRKLKNGTPEEQEFFQNLVLHYQAHVEMKQKLTPVPPLPVKMSASVAVDKLPPDVAAQALQAAGMKAAPESFENQLEPHEVTTEKEGVDANGVPVKQKVSMVGKGLQ